MAQPHCLEPLRCWFWRQGARRPPAGAGSEGEGPNEAVGKRRPMPLQKPTPNRSAADRSGRSPSIHPISASVRWDLTPSGPEKAGTADDPALGGALSAVLDGHEQGIIRSLKEGSPGLYVKLELTASKVIGRSFHLAHP